MEIPFPWVAGALAAVFLLALGWFATTRSLLFKLRQLQSMKQSQSTRHGQTLEQVAPFLDRWPGDPKQFRFLGSPVDGVQFNDDEVVFIEIKSGRSQLNANQRRIRELVESGRVRWLEFRLE